MHLPAPFALLTIATTAAAAIVPANLNARQQRCSSDNCLRALQRKEREASVYSFCTSLLSTSLATTATEAIPTYLGNCGPSSIVSRLSSACPCFLAGVSTTTSVPTATPTSSSTTGSQSSTSPPPGQSSSSSTTASSTSQCPGPITVTLPASSSTCSGSTVTLPASTVSITQPASTVTIPASTVTLPGSTITLPGTASTCEATTVTLPASTVTTAGPTVTAAPPARSCAQPLDDAGFEGLSPGLYPWIIAASAAWSVGQNKVGTGGSHFPPFTNNMPHSGSVAMCLHLDNPTPSGLWRLMQGFPPCGGITYRPQLHFATNAVGDGTFLVLRVQIYTTIASIGAATSTATRVYDKTLRLSTLAQGWTAASFDAFTMPADAASAVIYIDVSTTRTMSFVTWFDDIVLIRQ